MGAASSHSLAIKTDGSLWAWGGNKYGQLGTGNYVKTRYPLAVTGVTGTFLLCVGGGSHSMVLRSDDTIWGWGRSSFGQQGSGTFGFDPTPGQVAGALTGVTISKISAKSDNSLALEGTTSIYGWGYNRYGQLADGSVNYRNAPVQAQGLSGVITGISQGTNHTLALRSDGTVLAWGRNKYGQLGQNPSATPFSMTPVQVPGITTATAVAAGKKHSLALLSDDSILAWGKNTNGQLGTEGLTDYATMRSRPGPRETPSAPACSARSSW